jgi:hypothetical protein
MGNSCYYEDNSALLKDTGLPVFHKTLYDDKSAAMHIESGSPWA